MAAICILAGGMLGFLAALIGLVVFDISALSASLIWAGSGPLSIVIVALAQVARAPSAQPADNDALTWTA